MKEGKRVKWRKYLETVFNREAKRKFFYAYDRVNAGKKLSLKERVELWRNRKELVKQKEAKYLPMETSILGRHSRTFEELSKMLEGRKKVAINDVGYGEQGEEKSEATQPWEIIQALEKKGVQADYWGYDYYPWRAKLTEKQKPKEYKKKARFAGMDIVTSEPARRADVTVFLNVRPYLNKSEEKVAARHVIESTAKGGLVVTDVPLDQVAGKEKVKLLKIIKEDDGIPRFIYQKV